MATGGSEMKFMDMELARRVEMAEAVAMRSCAETAIRARPDLPIAIIEIAGGIAAYAGKDSPVTQAIGVGLDGPVADADLERLEEFFRSRGAAVALEICPLVDMLLYQTLAKRGYQLIEVSNVLVRDLKASTGEEFEGKSPEVVTRPAAAGEADLWTLTVAQGFAEHHPMTREITDAMSGFFHRENASSYLAFIGGEVAGGGAVAEHKGVGGLFGASTLPAFRRRGVQTALLAARLAWARDQQCDVAVSITQPGSISQRNIERFGFRVAYTRTKLVREWS
jgi:GNAT superfamily N-acetyltransferase